jgi:hypothetical protein
MNGLTLRSRSTRVAAGIIYACLVLVLTSIGVGEATESQTLIPFALPFAFVVIGASRLLGARVELFIWSALTAWLGLTYLQTGSPLEVLLLVVFVGLAVVAQLRSPLVLAAAWLFHPVWDFVPRTLPTELRDLPVACLLFDVPIGVYLFWQIRRGRYVRSTVHPGQLLSSE